MTITSTRYEEVAQILLDRFAADFGLSSVEGKQDMPGNLTGTSWEIDAKGVVEGSDAFLIVECRRYTTSKLAQEDVAAIAYRITDIGAAGAITVSPHDLQSGAKKVAAATNIVHVRLSPESTPQEFQLRPGRQLVALDSSHPGRACPDPRGLAAPACRVAWKNHHGRRRARRSAGCIGADCGEEGLGPIGPARAPGASGRTFRCVQRQSCGRMYP